MLQDQQGLDHIVINTRERIDEAAQTYRKLGFFVTDRSEHNLGTVNHLLVFSPSYTELLGAPSAVASWPRLADAPIGLRGIAFKTGNANALHAELKAMGIDAPTPIEVSRPVTVITGTHEARFRVVFLPDGTLPGGVYFFVEHLTPHLVFRDGWRVHRNGGVGIDRAVVITNDLACAAKQARRLFGEEKVTTTEQSVLLNLTFSQIEFVELAQIANRYGDLAAPPEGRETYMAALVIKVSLLDKVREALAESGVPSRDSGHGIVIAPDLALGYTLEFVQASWIGWSPYKT